MKLHLPVLLRKALLACFSFTFACTSSAAAADLTLGNEDSLTIDYADIASIPDLENGTLQLNGDTLLLLSNCGVGDGKTYTLLTGVSALLDAEGNAIVLDSSNNAISHYFDTTRPGTGFWADAALVYTADGTLQIVRHEENVQETLTFSTRQTSNLKYNYYEEISFKDIVYSTTSSSAYGGAIYTYGSVTMTSNGSVTFSGNSPSGDYTRGGAIYGRGVISLSNNGSVTFTGNSASDEGGAIYGYSSSTISLSDNGSVTFTGNSASAYGGAIYGGNDSTITLSNNGSVTFTGNSASSSSSLAHGGAIYGFNKSKISLSNNGSVEFSGNTASSSSSYAYGGAIDGSVTMTDNGSVTFSGNTAAARYYAYGGAIYTDGSVTMSGNGSVTFSGNEASDGGGAIYGRYDSTITLSNNGSVVFSGNSGGAICGGDDSTITLSNNDSVVFSGNYGGAIDGSSSSTISLSDNGSVTFSGNEAFWDYGGAIYGESDSTIKLSNNGSVTFSGNSASYDGGAICGSSSSTISLSDNGSVTFSGNEASGSDAYGGAIYTEGALHIRNNDSVEFAGNVEKNGSAYRLRSVYVSGGSAAVLNISAAAGKTVSFHDSIYVGSDATVNLNADYEDAEGNIIEQKGDIVFTGATTEDDLYKAKRNVAGTEEEIRLSRTTEVNAMTNLYGGRLRIEDGAIYQGYGITAHEGSEATVRVKDATLSHSGYDLIFNAGTTLELEGSNTITGNLDLMSGSSLVFENSGEFGVTIHEGALSIADDVCVDVRVDSSLWAEEYGETWDMVLLTTNATVEDGSVRYKISPLGETWGYSDVAWTDGTLAISFKKGAESALWQNTSGDYRWNTRSVNWMDGKYHFSNIEGASVVLGQTGAGTITLEGAISIAGLSVETGSSYELVLAEGASLSVSGALNVAENSQLDMGFGLSLSSVDNRGDLSLADDLTVSGAITGGGSLSVQGAASAASLQVGSLSVDSLTLTEATAQNTIGSSVSMAGAVAVAGGLSIDGSLSAASLQAGSLSVDSLTLTDAEAQNNIGSSVSMAGEAMVAGGLNIEGSFAAASLQTGSLSADSLTLTDAEAQNSIGSSVSMAGAVAVAGSLEIAGNLSAPEISVGGELKTASLQTDMLTTQSLTLTDAAAQNSIGSSVSMAGAATVAGGLSIDGSLSAASLQAGSLSATSLNLTTAEAQNSIGSSLSMTGNISVAGSLEIAGNLSAPEISVGGELKTASLQTDMLTTQSLTLTDAAVQNSIGSSVTMSGAAAVAGGLNIEGSLTAASLQAGSLSATALSLTDTEARNSIGSSLSMTGNISVAGSLEIAGNLSAPEISVGGELKAASLQTDMLTTQSLNLTDAELQNSIGSSVSMAGEAMVAGGLNIEGSFAAASLQTGSLSADSLTLTDAEAQNNIGSSVTMSGAAAVAGGLSIEGALTAASLQAGSLSATSLNLTTAEAQNSIGSSLSMTGNISVAGSLEIAGNLSAPKVSVGGELKAASLQTDMLTTQSLNLTDAELQNSIGSSVSMIGAATIAGGLNIEGSFSAASLQTGSLSVESLALTDAEALNCIGSSVSMAGAATVAGGLNIEGSLTAASLQAGSLSADSLTLTDAEAQNSIGSSVSFEGNATVAGSLVVQGSFTAAAVSVDSDFTVASLEADSLVSGGAVALTSTETANTVSGDMTVDSVSLAAGATLEVGGVLTADTVQMSGTATVLEAGSFGASEMDFVLDRAALENLGIAYGESATIARSGAALAAGYEALLNGSATESTDAAAYTYSIAVSGNEVKVEADYRWWDTRVWYRGAWVGEAEWEDLLIAGYDAVNGVETVDLGGESYSGYTLMVELEEGASAVSIANGSLKFDYIDMFAGDVNIGQNTTVQVAEMYGEGLKLGISGDKTTVTVSDYMQMGTVALDYARLTVADAEIGAITGTTGSLEITGDAQVTVDSDVTLSSLVNGGSLDMAGHALTVNGLTDVGGNVTAGEVIARSNMRTAATFGTLVADKVTVTNSNSNARYTDDLSVGDGSAIGELVAETLVVREGTVTLGRTDAAAEMELLKLNLKQNATLVLNQQTELAVTDTLTATSKAVVQLKKDASICYGDTSISNRNESGTVDVNAYALSGKADLVLERAHVSTRSSSAKVVDYQLINSSVENAGTGTLQLTHAGNSLTSIAATSGSVEVYNQAELNLEHLSIGRNQSLAVMSSDVAAGVDEEFEARVNIFGSATFGADSTLIADLSIQSGATIRIEGVVHMGSSITLSSGMVLAGAALENALSLNVAGDYVVLFDGVDSLILDGETPLVYSPGGLTVDDKVLASKYFMGLEEMENLYITFEENSDSESGNSSGGEVRLTLGSELIPEPTTSTLSLLALAALATRRRRR